MSWINETWHPVFTPHPYPSPTRGEGSINSWKQIMNTHKTTSLPLNWIILCLLGLAFLPLSARSAWNAVGDTLTVIQKPILNVPAIHIPGETLEITAIAPQTTTGWNAALLHGTKRVNLSIFSAQWQAGMNYWILQATVPQVPVFELYDLEVTAAGGIHDVTENAVHLIPSRKTNYYFIHITDTHLPNRLYYPNPGYDTDSTSVIDLREVIKDINLIRPEFVLFTGDLVNEGELEGLAGQYWYGWSQRVLALLEVPLYMVNGNHDLGGWNSTPGPQGSSRRNWWKYFGWPWLDNPNPGWNMYTQDYSFIYGNVHYIGMESYANYDNWRYNIYGYESFIPSQLTWLNSELALHPGTAKAMFYHYDFTEQLNLSSLGVGIGLWGHVHYNSGSIYEQPYNLSTRSVCDGNRAFRMIRVNGSSFTPQTTIYAGSSGTYLYENYYPSNNATADSVMCVVVNNNSQGFENGLIKFNMPPGYSSYRVTGGILEQVDRSADKNVCYVKVNIMANTTRYISVASTGVSNDDPVSVSPALMIRNAYPNPFRERASIVIEKSSAAVLNLAVYNQRGERIRSLHEGVSPEGESWYEWDGLDSKGYPAPAGIYFLRASSGQERIVKKIVRM